MVSRTDLIMVESLVHPQGHPVDCQAQRCIYPWEPPMTSKAPKRSARSVFDLSQVANNDGMDTP